MLFGGKQILGGFVGHHGYGSALVPLKSHAEQYRNGRRSLLRASVTLLPRQSRFTGEPGGDGSSLDRRDRHEYRKESLSPQRGDDGGTPRSDALAAEIAALSGAFVDDGPAAPARDDRTDHARCTPLRRASWVSSSTASDGLTASGPGFATLARPLDIAIPPIEALTNLGQLDAVLSAVAATEFAATRAARGVTSEPAPSPAKASTRVSAVAGAAVMEMSPQTSIRGPSGLPQPVRLRSPRPKVGRAPSHKLELGSK